MDYAALLAKLGENIIWIGRGHFLVESWTEPGEYHAVDLEDRTCSCKGWQCTGNCRHLKTLLEAVEDFY